MLEIGGDFITEGESPLTRFHIIYCRLYNNSVFHLMNCTHAEKKVTVWDPVHKNISENSSFLNAGQHPVCNFSSHYNQ